MRMYLYMTLTGHALRRWGAPHCLCLQLPDSSQRRLVAETLAERLTVTVCYQHSFGGPVHPSSGRSLNHDVHAVSWAKPRRKLP